MSDRKHTPGPWSDGIHDRVRNGGREYAHIRGGNEIVPIAAVPLGSEGYTNGYEQGVANARLIAAAPDLLAQLKHAIHWHDQLSAEDIARYMAVVDKAEGRS